MILFPQFNRFLRYVSDSITQRWLAAVFLLECPSKPVTLADRIARRDNWVLFQ